MKLSELLERIKTQLAHEYPDQERREYELANMTVKRLLEMLEYMGDDK